MGSCSRLARVVAQTPARNAVVNWRIRRQKGLQSTPTLLLSSDFHATEARGWTLRDALRSSDNTRRTSCIQVKR